MKRYHLFLALIVLGRLLTFVPWLAIGACVVLAEMVHAAAGVGWNSLKDTIRFVANHVWEPIDLLRRANDPTYRHRKHLLATASPSWREMPWRLVKHSCGLAI